MKRQFSQQTHDRARRLRRDMTDAERALWRILRSRLLDGWKFRRQVPLGPYIADFASHSARLVVEADGGQHDRESDAARTSFLEGEGYRVLRFWNNDILTNPEGVATTIAGNLHRHHPHPTPFPLGRGLTSESP